MNRNQPRIWRIVTLVLSLALIAGASFAQNPPCKAVDNGSGTVTLPPANCGYISPQAFHEIDLSGLAPGTKILLDPSHERFICGKQGCGTPGGTLGGEIEQFGSTLRFKLTGTGALSGWSRTITVPANCETHTGPRRRGAAVQSFPTSMYRLEGALAGDPDFQSLHIVAGKANGYDSPGKTTLVKQADGTYVVDSTFTINYRIDFVGNPDGVLKGLEGSSEGSVPMQAAGLGTATDADTTGGSN